MYNAEGSGTNDITALTQPHSLPLNDAQPILRAEINQNSIGRTENLEINEFDCRPFRGPKTPPTPLLPIGSPGNKRLPRKEENSKRQITQAELSILNRRTAQRSRQTFNKRPQQHLSDSRCRWTQTQAKLNRKVSQPFIQPLSSLKKGQRGATSNFRQRKSPPIYVPAHVSIRGDDRGLMRPRRGRSCRFDEEYTEHPKSRMNHRFAHRPKRFDCRRRIYSQYSGRSHLQQTRRAYSKNIQSWSPERREGRLQSVITKCSSSSVKHTSRIQIHSQDSERERSCSAYSASLHSQQSSLDDEDDTSSICSNDTDPASQGCARCRIYVKQFTEKMPRYSSPMHAHISTALEEEGEVLSGDESVNSEGGRHILTTSLKRSRTVHHRYPENEKDSTSQRRHSKNEPDRKSRDSKNREIRAGRSAEQKPRSLRRCD